MMLLYCCRRRHTNIYMKITFVVLIVILFGILAKHHRSNTSVDVWNLALSTDFNDRKGIQVVIGHYVGNDIISRKNPRITREELNENLYNPVPGAGEMGEPVQLSPFDSSRIQRLHVINQFNLVASDRISVNRSLPDVRKSECRSIIYDETQLSATTTTSVVIVFHNEAWSTLLRTVHSVINRSPSHLIREIILVDDASDRDFLKTDLDSYVQELSVKIVTVHIDKRVGLIKARLRGAAVSSGDVLTFLDAHCECTEGWLQPLLSRIAENRTNVVCPIIDIINDDTFAYVKSFDMHWGAINWDLHYRWFPVGEETLKLRQSDPSSPFKSPVMAGGLFAIDKKYFYQLGAYDDQMDIWGGENIELSFRVWQCGGSIEIVPCSHVGHVFRKASPYSFPGGIASVLFTNFARVAQVWMDDWKNFFFKLHPEADAASKVINVTERLQLREQLQCRSFQWFLENVWVDHFFPTADSIIGTFRNSATGFCLRRPRGPNGGNQATGNALTAPCNTEMVNQILFIVTPAGFVMSDESVCLDVLDITVKEPAVFLLGCTREPRQRWNYDFEDEAFVHEESKLCLDLGRSPGRKLDRVILTRCIRGKKRTQQWRFSPFQWR